MSLNTQHTTNTNYNKHNFCDVPRPVKIKHHPLSVRGDQGSSVVIHGQSVAIRYHPMSVREDQSSCRSVKINHHMAISDRHLSVREGQASSFVSLHQGMRLPDKQTRYRQARQARQQGRSQSFWIWVLRSTVRPRTFISPLPAAAPVCVDQAYRSTRLLLALVRQPGARPLNKVRRRDPCMRSSN